MEELILSVSMPNFNHASYLPKRIPSLLCAMPKNSELIIVDDGSTDGSAEIIQNFSKQDERILFIKKRKNEGVIIALQEILKIARGKFISFQSSDDWILPNFFFTLLNFSKNYPGFAIYTSHFGYCQKQIPEDLNEIKSNPLIDKAEKPSFFHADQIVKVFFKTNFWIPGHASIIQKDFAIKAGGFITSLSHHSDWFMIHAAALLGGVAYLPETLAIWRLANDSFSFQQHANKKELYKVQMSFFRILRRKEKKELRSLFRRSGVLRGCIRCRLISLFFRPIYWDFLIFYTIGFFQRRFRRLCKIQDIDTLQKILGKG